ncbi:MAG TPA: efflux RND transporter periplasmic adaptor subunit [Candidatus Kapabacteria bacterium]|nr:efflux RND transporter periplasmic adaptor subunit [Candidatus Kapabacteria bacterium]
MAETTVIQAPKPQADGTAAKLPLAPPTVVMKKVTLGQKKRKISPAIIVLGVVVLGVVFWYFFLHKPAAAPTVVRYSAVDMGDISRSVTATGTLQATTTVQVGSQISGLVKKIYADFNTKVKAGQLLALLDTTPYSAALAQSEATVTKAKADVELARANEARSHQLLSAQLISQSDYDVTKNALQDALATYSQDSAQHETAVVNLSYTHIRSPVDGVVQARDVDSGQTVAAGLNVTTLYVIAEDLTKMQVAAAVDEADIGSVAIGQDVSFTVEAFPNETFHGVVWQVRINPVTTQNVVTYTVIINTPNPDERLLPGMTATVNIINASRTNVMRVPVAATRFVPPPDFLASMGMKGADTVRQRKPRAAGDTSHHGMTVPGLSGPPSAENKPTYSTVYIKTNAKSGAQLQPVHVVGGLSDGNYTEVLKSTPPLKVGDSVVVAAFEMNAAAPSAASSPIGGRAVMHH